MSFTTSFVNGINSKMLHIYYDSNGVQFSGLLQQLFHTSDWLFKLTLFVKEQFKILLKMSLIECDKIFKFQSFSEFLHNSGRLFSGQITNFLCLKVTYFLPKIKRIEKEFSVKGTLRIVFVFVVGTLIHWKIWPSSNLHNHAHRRL